MDNCNIGIISDTHGRLRNEVENALKNSDLIIHAGDIGGMKILDSLKKFAPVVAVRGNNDKGNFGKRFSKTEAIEIGNKILYVIHDLSELDIEPEAANISAVIYGHSHKPSIEFKNNVLYLNPGSAGPRRFKLPVCVAHILIEDEKITASVTELIH